MSPVLGVVVDTEYEHGDHHSPLAPLALGVAGTVDDEIAGSCVGADVEIEEGRIDPYRPQTPPSSVGCSWHS